MTSNDFLMQFFCTVATVTRATPEQLPEVSIVASTFSLLHLLGVADFGREAIASITSLPQPFLPRISRLP
jgi:hypothetical protein